MLCAEALRKLYRAQRKKVLQLPSTQYKREGEIFDIKTFGRLFNIITYTESRFHFLFFRWTVEESLERMLSWVEWCSSQRTNGSFIPNSARQSRCNSTESFFHELYLENFQQIMQCQSEILQQRHDTMNDTNWDGFQDSKKKLESILCGGSDPKSEPSKVENKYRRHSRNVEHVRTGDPNNCG